MEQPSLGREALIGAALDEVAVGAVVVKRTIPDAGEGSSQRRCGGAGAGGGGGESTDFLEEWNRRLHPSEATASPARRQV